MNKKRKGMRRIIILCILICLVLPLFYFFAVKPTKNELISSYPNILNPIFKNGIDYDSSRQLVSVRSPTNQLLGEIQLITPLNNIVIDEGNKLQTVAVIRFNSRFQYNSKNLVDHLELQDLRASSKNIERIYQLKQRINARTIQVPIYDSNCTRLTSPNLTQYDFCSPFIKGYRNDVETKLVDLPEKFEANTDYIIEIQADVKPNDYVEWIPYVYKDLGSIKITQWAKWTEGLNEGLFAYFTLNETTGTNARNSILYNFNGTLDGAFQSITGAVGYAWNLSCASLNGDIDFGTQAIVGTAVQNNYTMTFKFKLQPMNSYNAVLCTRNDGGSNRMCIFRNQIADKMTLYYTATEIASIDETALEDYRWHTWSQKQAMLPDGTLNTSVFVDGYYVGNKVHSVVLPNEKLRYGRQGNSGNYFCGAFDEVSFYNRTLSESEILTLNESVTYGDVNKLNASFISQVPADLSTSNIFGSNLTLNFNITSVGTVSNATLYYFLNSTPNNCTVYLNGSLTNCNYLTINYSYYTGDIFTWQLGDNQVYTGKYNFDERTLEIAPKLNFSLNTTNQRIKTRILNMSNSTGYSLLEFYAINLSQNSFNMPIYYCNSSYTNGSTTTSQYCTQFYVLRPIDRYNHTHINSKHYVIALPIDTAQGKLNNIAITPTSYFVHYGLTGGGTWNLKYIENVSRADTMQYSSDGGMIWRNVTGTTDLHIHQFNGLETLNYYMNVTDSLGSNVQTPLRYDLINLSGIPPTKPLVYAPISQLYQINLTINFSSSSSPNGYAITFYNISLYNTDGSHYKTLIQNTTEFFHIVNITSENTGEYLIGVTAYDQNNQTATGFSENFTINNYLPISCANDTVYVVFSSYPYVDLNQSFNISLYYFNSGMSRIQMMINDSSGNISYFNFTYSPLTLSYSISLIPTVVDNYRFTIFGDGFCPTVVQNISGYFFSRSPFNVTIRLFNADDNSSIWGSLAWVTAEFVNFKPDSNIETYLNPLIFNPFRPKVFHAPYQNGKAEIKLYEPNTTYTFRYFRGSPQFSGQYGYYNITKLYGENIYLSSEKLNDTDTGFDYFLTEKDLHPYRWLFNTILILIVVLSVVVGIFLFFVIPDKPFIALIFTFLFIGGSIVLRTVLWIWKGY